MCCYHYFFKKYFETNHLLNIYFFSFLQMQNLVLLIKVFFKLNFCSDLFHFVVLVIKKMLSNYLLSYYCKEIMKTFWSYSYCFCFNLIQIDFMRLFSFSKEKDIVFSLVIKASYMVKSEVKFLFHALLEHNNYFFGLFLKFLLFCFYLVFKKFHLFWNL